MDGGEVDLADAAAGGLEALPAEEHRAADLEEEGQVVLARGDRVTRRVVIREPNEGDPALAEVEATLGRERRHPVGLEGEQQEVGAGSSDARAGEVEADVDLLGARRERVVDRDRDVVVAQGRERRGELVGEGDRSQRTHHADRRRAFVSDVEHAHRVRHDRVATDAEDDLVEVCRPDHAAALHRGHARQLAAEGVVAVRWACVFDHHRHAVVREHPIALAPGQQPFGVLGQVFRGQPTGARFRRRRAERIRVWCASRRVEGGRRLAAPTRVFGRSIRRATVFRHQRRRTFARTPDR